MLPLFEHLQSKCYFMRAVARNAEKMLTIRLFRQTERTDTIRYRFFLFIQTLSPCEPLSPADPSSLCRVRCMKYP